MPHAGDVSSLCWTHCQDAGHLLQVSLYRMHVKYSLRFWSFSVLFLAALRTLMSLCLHPMSMIIKGTKIWRR